MSRAVRTGLWVGAALLAWGATAAARCADPAAVLRGRATVGSSCPCLGPVHDPEGRGWVSRRQYLRCVGGAARAAVVAGVLPRGCLRPVRRAALRSTCARPGSMPCCGRRTGGGSACRVTRRAASCRARGGSVGVSASCADACEAPAALPGLCESAVARTLAEDLVSAGLFGFVSPFLHQANERHAYVINLLPGAGNAWYLAHLAMPCSTAVDFEPYCDAPLRPGVPRDCSRLSCVEPGRWQARGSLRSLPALVPGSFGRPELTLRLDTYESVTEWRHPPVLGPSQVTWEYGATGTWHSAGAGGGEFGLEVSALAAWMGDEDWAAVPMTVRLHGVVREGELVVVHDPLQLSGSISVGGTEVGSVVEDRENGSLAFRFTSCE